MAPKRILLSSYRFHPSIGGQETSSLFLAKGFVERGHQVTVVTATPGDTHGYPYKVVREPSAGELYRLVRDADIVWQNHIALRHLWPLALLSRPLVFMHHISLRMLGDVKPHLGNLKRFVSRMGRNVFVSKALRDESALPGDIVPNSYDEKTFRVIPGIERDRDLVFVGRLRRYKGADLLVDAVADLAAQGIEAKTTVVGLGKEADALKAQAAEKGLAKLIDFPGPQTGEELARILNRHKILVIPSRCEEAFGIVGLEALACGCVVVAADSGGLPEVLGPAAKIFPKENSRSLAAILKTLLTDQRALDDVRRNIPAQLAKYDKSMILDACERVIDEATRASPSGTVGMARN